MGEQEIKFEQGNILFAKAMEIMTWVGLVFMGIPGVAYLIEERGFVGVSSAYHNWDKPAAAFWQATKGIKVNGYLWFLDHLTRMDCLSLIGIVVLSLVPLLSMMVVTPKMNNKYRIIMIIVAIEFIIAIIRPFL